MGLTSLVTAFVAVTQLFALSTNAFDPTLNNNLVVYWGQAANQERLSYYCQNDTIDIIVLGFVYIFPDQGALGLPGTNFGNQCSGATYEIDGEKSELLTADGCHQIVEDIPICQAAGKKVLLSLGGSTDTYGIKNKQSARDFADFLWGAFGPRTFEWEFAGKPRPFGDNVVDGFDFDIEHNKDTGYTVMADRLRENFKEDSSKRYYLSAAPQCEIPDDHLDHSIRHSSYDFIFVQFYNTPSCRAAIWPQRTPTDRFNFDKWVDLVRNSNNPSAKLFIGLPGSKDASGGKNTPDYYVSPADARRLVTLHLNNNREIFGGVMVWEATHSENNQIDGRSYAEHIKEILLDASPR